jgi:hypothetical protein
MSPILFASNNLSWIIVGLIALITLFGLHGLYRLIWPKKIYFRRYRLLSPAELRFFHTLQHVAGNQYWVFTKIRVADLVDIRGLKGRQWWRSFSQISQKHIDFVVTDRQDMEVLAAIELDDRSHQLVHRKQRDHLVNAIFNQAGIPLLHFPVNCSTAHLRQSFQETLGTQDRAVAES